ncbi:hypothetical protein HGA64_03405 [Candidatus Falkowbacteria bacterium]|nr:hypothetical protein [Candidatus Falkowbacteria bacterium]
MENVVNAEERLLKIEEELRLVKERNAKVETDKAWETSGSRIFAIAAITYIVASIVMLLIGTANYYLNALIPVVGYLLSTRSLPAIKDWWIKKYKK